MDEPKNKTDINDFMRVAKILASDMILLLGVFTALEVVESARRGDVNKETLYNISKEISIKLNKNQMTVREACHSMRARGVPDEEIEQIIQAADILDPTGFKYGAFRYGVKKTRFVTEPEHTPVWSKEWWYKPDRRTRAGWKRKNKSGEEEWVDDSFSMVGDRYNALNQTEFEKAHKSGSRNKKGLQYGGSRSENTHSTQSQSEEMKEDTGITQNRSTAEDLNTKSSHTSEDKMVQDTSTAKAFVQADNGDRSWSRPIGNKSQSQYIQADSPYSRIITSDDGSFYQLPIVRLIIILVAGGVYWYYRRKSPPASKQQNIGGRGEVDKSFSAEKFQAAMRFIPWVESYDRKTRQDLYKVLLDFNSGSFTRKQAVFVLTNHFDLKEAEIDQLLEINSKKDEAS